MLRAIREMLDAGQLPNPIEQVHEILLAGFAEIDGRTGPRQASTATGGTFLNVNIRTQRSQGNSQEICCCSFGCPLLSGFGRFNNKLAVLRNRRDNKSKKNLTTELEMCVSRRYAGCSSRLGADQRNDGRH